MNYSYISKNNVSRSAVTVSVLTALFFIVSTSSVAAAEKQEYIVEKTPSCTIAQTAANVEGESSEQLTETMLLTTTSQSAKELRKRPCVVSVGKNKPIHLAGQPNDPEFDKQWSLNNTGQTIGDTQGIPDVDIGYTQVYENITNLEETATVAVLDSGVASISELKGRVLPGKDVIENDGNPTDEDGHGTIMSSIMAAEINNGAEIAGINDNIQILPVRVMGENKGSVATLIQGLDYAIEQDVDVINLSITTTGLLPYHISVTPYIREAHNKGISIISASGNDGEKLNILNKRTPVSNEYEKDWVIGVGAHTNTGERASFSNYGKFVDIMAPGKALLKNTTLGSGTSHATAITSGVVATLDIIFDGVSPARAYDLITSYSSNNRLDMGAIIKGIQYPDGTLLRSPTSGIFLIEDGKKRPIPHPSVFLSHNYNWEDVVVTNQEQLNLYPRGEQLKLRDGSVVADDQSVYIIDEGQRRPVKSPQVFLNAGYEWSDVKEPPKGILNSHPKGNLISDPGYVPNGTVIYSEKSSGVFLVQDGKKRPFYNPDIFLNRYSWEDTVKVEHSKLKSFPRGEEVYPRSGSLLADSETVYVIDDRKRRAFVSSDIFEKRGYDWSNVQEVSKDTINLFSEGNIVR